MNGVSREEINNLIQVAKLEWKNEHAVEGCEFVRKVQNYIDGDLRSDIHDFKTANEVQLGLSQRLEILDNAKTGQVTILWEERNAVVKWLIGTAISIIIFMGGFYWTQNTSLKKTDAKLDLTCQYQLAQTLFVKFSATGDISAKLEAEEILKKLSIK